MSLTNAPDFDPAIGDLQAELPGWMAVQNEGSEFYNVMAAIGQAIDSLSALWEAPFLNANIATANQDGLYHTFAYAWGLQNEQSPNVSSQLVALMQALSADNGSLTSFIFCLTALLDTPANTTGGALVTFFGISAEYDGGSASSTASSDADGGDALTGINAADGGSAGTLPTIYDGGATSTTTSPTIEDGGSSSSSAFSSDLDGGTSAAATVTFSFELDGGSASSSDVTVEDGGDANGNSAPQDLYDGGTALVTELIFPVDGRGITLYEFTPGNGPTAIEGLVFPSDGSGLRFPVGADVAIISDNTILDDGAVSIGNGPGLIFSSNKFVEILADPATNVVTVKVQTWLDFDRDAFARVVRRFQDPTWYPSVIEEVPGF